jgi:hypothetical protein
MGVDRAVGIAGLMIGFVGAILTVLCTVFARELALWGKRRHSLGVPDAPTFNRTTVTIGNIVVAAAPIDHGRPQLPSQDAPKWQTLRQSFASKIEDVLEGVGASWDKIDENGKLVLIFVAWFLLVAAGVLFLNWEHAFVLIVSCLAVLLCTSALVTLLFAIWYGVGLRWNASGVFMIALISAAAAAVLPRVLVSPIGVFGRFHDLARDLPQHLDLAAQAHHLLNVYGLDVVAQLVFQSLGCLLVIGVLFAILPTSAAALWDVLLAARGRPRQRGHSLDGRKILTRCSQLVIGMLLASGLATGGFDWLQHHHTEAFQSAPPGTATAYGTDLAGVGLMYIDSLHTALVLNYCKDERILRVVERVNERGVTVVFSSTRGERPSMLPLQTARIDAATALSFTVTTTHHDPERIVMTQAPAPGSVVSMHGSEPVAVFRTRTPTC